MSKARLSVFPAFHKTSGRPVLIVGEGAEVVAKLRLILETDAVPRLIAKAPQTELAALIVGHDVEHYARSFRHADLDGVVLAFAAISRGTASVSRTRRSLATASAPSPTIGTGQNAWNGKAATNRYGTWRAFRCRLVGRRVEHERGVSLP